MQAKFRRRARILRKPHGTRFAAQCLGDRYAGFPLGGRCGMIQLRQSHAAHEKRSEVRRWALCHRRMARKGNGAGAITRPPFCSSCLRLRSACTWQGWRHIRAPTFFFRQTITPFCGQAVRSRTYRGFPTPMPPRCSTTTTSGTPRRRAGPTRYGRTFCCPGSRTSGRRRGSGGNRRRHGACAVR